MLTESPRTIHSAVHCSSVLTLDIFDKRALFHISLEIVESEINKSSGSSSEFVRIRTRITSSRSLTFVEATFIICNGNLSIIEQRVSRCAIILQTVNPPSKHSDIYAHDFILGLV